ncbi:multiple sugar transport system permease protein [Metamycoplasma subdolum]|uniref:Multiple sugar transport system permease protein n=1 Tax=Metamycoplasma subdolum TaxID=92407 RepID=A0A3M0A9N1_9BACT|nr:sugar ABC transporter permease [Metamycoplasma subdolum]RMA79095.1 multiple sugar transport system permease protein [Metamycoplasma subdolum]WPB50618.1 sugar ABC transporter permease [Metamycoplasma subdolum]
MKRYFWKKMRVKNIGDNLSILSTRTPYWKPFLLILPSFLTILLFTLIPFILVIYKSFLDRGTGFYIDEAKLSTANYVNIFKDYGFQTGIRNSIVYAIIALPISLTCSLLIAIAITQVVKKWARSFWQTVFFLPYVTSMVAVSISFIYIFRREGGIINTLLQKLGLIKKPLLFLQDTSDWNWSAFGVIVFRGVWGNLAFQVLILTTAMLSVDQNLYRAGSIDGAYKAKQFFAITLPSIKPTLSFLITIGIIGGIKIFPLALFDNSPETAVAHGGSSIMLYIYSMVRGGEYGRSGAASVILFVLGVTISFGLRKLVTLAYKASTKIGALNVTRKIETQTLKSKTTFKV